MTIIRTLAALSGQGLQARVGRQLQSKNKMRWHIDSLLAHTAIAAVWNVDGPRQLHRLS
ncbi:MAG: hypothetical protein HOL98_01115 [Gammaproteobacteria bacterium]|nr:hypothetical protein [Gammaproteobacteria bacterium]MBT5202029.1 hypothetical protein [Gammaproteobacteria bacterium]MBT5600737.1 hypothetical protein [Gammaproteobacteria bacterium]MBT6244301.1 hypothetical protein [Gammaproteobacteria bacterium]